MKISSDLKGQVALVTPLQAWEATARSFAQAGAAVTLADVSAKQRCRRR